MACDAGRHDFYAGFPGVPADELEWGSLTWHQVMTVSKGRPNGEIIAWIERWTGIKNMEVKISWEES
jgi:hypothetical protein